MGNTNYKNNYNISNSNYNYNWLTRFWPIPAVFSVVKVANHEVDINEVILTIETAIIETTITPAATTSGGGGGGDR